MLDTAKERASTPPSPIASNALRFCRLPLFNYNALFAAPLYLLAQASRKIRPYRNFEGLSAEAARDLRSYFHFRNPESIKVGA